jgi:hypothetical protein
MNKSEKPRFRYVSVSNGEKQQAARNQKVLLERRDLRVLNGFLTFEIASKYFCSFV